MTQSELVAYAEQFRTDNDDNSRFFFPAHEGYWEERTLHPSDFSDLWQTSAEAKEYLEAEIRMRVKDELPHADFVDMLRHGVKERVVVTCINGQYRLWDGHHRVATAIIRNEPIPAVVGWRHLSEAI
ncbi:hypothetical protein pEaSNUABM11_00208 [Erwinia phage pEa_SNUABM_11]|nr:hypothetical protein pEaSNUABM11_00208 [Erwinia phage pEa_SNUABM_11]